QGAVRVDIGTHDERRAAVAHDLERRLQTSAPLDESPGERADECEIPRSTSAFVPTALVDAPHDLGVEPEACVECEPPAVHATGGDVTRPVVCTRFRVAFGCVNLIARKSVRTTKQARHSTRHECYFTIHPV